MIAAYKNLVNKPILYSDQLTLGLKPEFLPLALQQNYSEAYVFVLCSYVLFSVKFGVQVPYAYFSLVTLYFLVKIMTDV